MQVKIGCTGWSYEGWNGVFYPANLPQTDQLRHYSSIFNLTEINSTFYRIPTKSMAERWNRETPQNFIFTAKLPKIITHENRLKPNPYLDQFIDSIRPLGSKMKLLVIQLPPSLSFDESEERLEKMLSHLPKDYRYAVEGRHESWFSEQVYDYLREKNVSLVWNEVEGVKNPAPVTSDFVYLRLVGDRSITEREFGRIQRDRTSEMRYWIEKVQGANVPLAIFAINNHFQGFAPESANMLRQLLGLERLSFVDRRQKTLGEF